MSDGELIYTSYNKPLRIFVCNRAQIRADGAVHPTQKPLKILLWLFETYAKDAKTILDPFMGSGSTGVACVNTGRDFIGVEKDPEYFKIAKRRIKGAL